MFCFKLCFGIKDEPTSKLATAKSTFLKKDERTDVTGNHSFVSENYPKRLSRSVSQEMFKITPIPFNDNRYRSRTRRVIKKPREPKEKISTQSRENRTQDLHSSSFSRNNRSTEVHYNLPIDQLGTMSFYVATSETTRPHSLITKSVINAPNQEIYSRSSSMIVLTSNVSLNSPVSVYAHSCKSSNTYETISVASDHSERFL